MKTQHFLFIIILGFVPITTNSQIVDTLVDNDRCLLHFSITKGKGMPILFESGQGNDVTIWNDILPPLANITGAPIITYERQGYGKSTIDPDCKSIEDEIKVLELNTGLYPESISARNALAYAYLKTGHKELASEHYHQLLKFKSHDENTLAVIDRISRIIEISDSVLSSYAGDYELNGIPVSITKVEDMLFIHFNNTRSAVYFTSNVDGFIADYGNDGFKFVKDTKGKVLGFNFMGMQAVKVR